MQTVLVFLLVLVTSGVHSSTLNDIPNESVMGLLMKSLKQALSDYPKDSPFQVADKWTKILHKRVHHVKKTIDPPPLPGKQWGFMPTYLGTVPRHGQFSWASDCYSNNTAKIRGSLLDERTVDVVSTGRKSTNKCEDYYMFGTIDGFAEIKVPADDATKHWNAPLLSFKEKGGKEWYERVGIYLFKFRGNWEQTIADIVATVELFEGDEVDTEPLREQEYVLNFLKNYSEMDWVRRDPAHYLVNIDPKTIKSGTAMAIMRPDGLGAIQMWATGAHTMHFTMLMRGLEDDELYIVESTDTTPYWPIPNIQMNRWDKWIPLALKANYSINLLPLKPELQKVFNATRAWEFIKPSIGLPYGYHNFLFGWLDTPTGNLPAPLSPQNFEMIFGALNLVDHKFAHRLFIEAFNFRVSGTWRTNYTLAECINKAAVEKGLTFGELYSIPELSKWVYNDGPSMVCDVFDCGIYNAGGVFGAIGKDINCVEFSNRDFYQLDVFEISVENRPEVCKQADPTLPYCALMGPWQVDLPGVSTIKPYARMDEHCAALPPKYNNHPPGC